MCILSIFFDAFLILMAICILLLVVCILVLGAQEYRNTQEPHKPIEEMTLEELNAFKPRRYIPATFGGKCKLYAKCCGREILDLLLDLIGIKSKDDTPNGLHISDDLDDLGDLDNLDAPICCPICGFKQITANTKGFGVGKAAAGGLMLGPVGLLGGFIGKNKIIITCLKCGHHWKP